MRRSRREPQLETGTRAFLLQGAGTFGITVAAIWRRFGALLADLIIALPIMAAAGVLFQRMLVSTGVFPRGLAWYDTLATGFARKPGVVPGMILACFTSFLLVRAAQLLFSGRTLGMRLFGLIFRTGEGGSPSAGRLMLRELFALLSLSALGGGYLWAFFDDAFRPWHDKLSGIFTVPQETEAQLFSPKRKKIPILGQGRK